MLSNKCANALYESMPREPAPDWTTLSRLPFIDAHYHLDSIDSTSSYAKNLDNLAKDALVLVTADYQTHGRGQRDNTFFSGVSGGIYASIVCPIGDMSKHFCYNRALSLAITDTLRRAVPDAPLLIKWPNDIYWANRKVCGILLESTAHSTRHLVLGFGINVNIPHKTFPGSLQTTATSLFIQTGTTFDCARILSNICETFWYYRTRDQQMVHQSYCRQLYKSGCRIKINGHTGIFETIREDGHLCLIENNGKIYFSSGSIEFIL